ncbi:stage II sporulation protein M [Halorubrum vacuolatum]|uniref:Stage II sporulation protein M n=1 Tax=Halorubrum vacuolatum TaxID=63740 RepID=A0A238UVI3_HALVU|nr:stage II sporulation protein M [Halorubrum vacuolatum]SNR25747.1 Stage II sporulation protein M [Halorubrum vacuolatum]
MDLSSAITAVVSTLRRRPGDLLPFYLLSTAIPIIARTAGFLSLAAVYVHLEVSGRLAEAQAAAEGADLTPPDLGDPGEFAGEEPDPDAFDEAELEAWLEGIFPVIEPLLSPVAIALLALGIGASILIAAGSYAAISAGQMRAVFARLRSERGLTAGIVGVRRHWLTFLGLYLTEFALWIGVILLGTLAIGVGFVINPFVGAAVALGVFLIGFVVLVAIRILFAFAPAAVVVDDAGVAGSLTGAGGFIRSNPIDAAAYLVVAIGVLVGASSAASALAFVGGGAAVALAAAVVVAPALDLLKTVLYGDHRGAVDPVDPPEARVRDQFVGGIRRGWREMAAFVRVTPGLHLFTVAIAVGFGVLGWLAAAPFVDVFSTSIEARLEGHFPPSATLEFFGNNWTVAISTAMAGVALVIPAISSVAFNGFVLAGVAALEENLEVLIAFVIPHGIFEIPAIIISGALGVHLGLVAWRTFRGRTGREAFADAMENAFWVLLGVGILIAIAAVIEGFISPYYWRFLL